MLLAFVAFLINIDFYELVEDERDGHNCTYGAVKYICR